MKPPFNLKCEYLTNAQGIDCLKPRFSWIAEHAGRNQRQQAYQILVSSTPELAQQETGDIWDSGRVEDTRTYNIRYAGA
ncbi:hypothetical protein GF337_16480, partial [candidate division KSB1 bacterium]|nr:hypothetical protein [candidate division KSB1 bacterium]